MRDNPKKNYFQYLDKNHVNKKLQKIDYNKTTAARTALLLCQSEIFEILQCSNFYHNLVVPPPPSHSFANNEFPSRRCLFLQKVL